MARKFNLRRYQGPGKFEGGLAIDELAYELSMDGCDEDCGDAQTTGWSGLLRGPFKSEGAFRAISATAVIEHALTPDELDYLGQVAGCIVQEDSQGFVSVAWFDTKDELDDVWAKVEAACDEDEDEDEDEEPCEPDDDDITTPDHSEFYQYGKLAFTVPSDATTEEMWEAIEAHMEATGFYPNVWSISDHGNAHIMTRPDA